MKILLITRSGFQFDETSLNSTGLGGSETWCTQLSNAFSKKGHDTTVLCNCESHVSQLGVRYMNTNETSRVISEEKFDLIIISRDYSNLFSGIDYYKTSDNVFIQAHDYIIYGDEFSKIKNFPCFKGVATLSAYQEKSIHDNCYVDWQYMVRIGNGIDPELFNNLNYFPTNRRLLFSSQYLRGGDILKDYVSPRLVDSGADFLSPSYSVNEIEGIEENECVRILGNLPKGELYKEMSNRYCWFYPGVFNETFCITMLENIMCENDIIAPLTYGMSSVIEPFVNDVSMKYRFDRSEDEFWMAVEEAVNKINESFCDYEKGEELRKELKNYALCNYTWDRIADKWLKLV